MITKYNFGKFFKEQFNLKGTVIIAMVIILLSILYFAFGGGR